MAHFRLGNGVAELIGAGVDPRTAATRLGHANPTLTLATYATVITDNEKAAAAITGEISN